MKQYTIKKINILQKIKFFYSQYENNKSTLLSSLNFYFAPTAEYYGLLKILKFSKELNTFSLYVKIIKNILGGIFFSNPKIIKKNKIINYSNVIITWANKANFNIDGSLDDKYFNISTKKTKKTLWIVIYLDKHLPKYIKKRLNKNIIIYKNDFKNYNFLDFIKFIYKKLIHFKNFELLIHNLSNYAFFSEKFYEKTSKYFLKNLDYLYLPYEAQPFQNKIIYNLKKKKIKTKIIGYVHAAPLSFPANYIYKKYSPHKIIVNGEDQKDCFIKYLYWPKKLITVKSSVRFFKAKNNNMRNKIFLPLAIRNHKYLLNSFNNLITLHKYNLRNFIIQKHPHSINSINITNFEKKLKKLISSNKKIKNNRNQKNLSIFIGSSGAIIEALERGLNVFQVCESPIIETYSNKLLKNILIQKLDNNIFSYKLKNKSKILKLGKFNDHQNYITNI